MARRINRDVLPEHPDLVIWQVGTNGVLRDQDPINVVESVRQGVARIKASGQRPSADESAIRAGAAPA